MSRLRLFLSITALSLGLVLFVWWLQPPSYLESFPSPKAGPFPTPEILEGALTIEGLVQDSQGTGIAGAWVTAAGVKRIVSAPCDAAGRFRLEGLAAGTFEITAAAPGFRPASASIKAGEGTITIGLQPLGVFGQGPNPPPPPAERYKLNCKIQREGGSSAGFVVALVPESVLIPSAIARATVDSSGIFQIDGIYPGAYTLRVLSAAKEQDLLHCFAAVPMEFGPGKTAPDLISFSTRSIRGVVLSPPVPDLLPAPPDWSPQEGAVVRLTLLTSEGSTTDAGYADTDAEGRFEFRNLPDGDYRVEAIAAEFERMAVAVERAQGPSVDLKLALVRKRP